MTQQDNASPSFPVSSLPPPAVTSKPVLPPPSSGFLPPPPASAQFIVRTSSTSLTPQPSLDFDDDDDDDWDDFQANEESPAASSQQPVEEQTERETDETQGRFPHPSTSTSTDHVDEDEKGTTHVGSDLPTLHDTPAQETGEDTKDHISSADSLVDSLEGTVDKEGSLDNEASVSPHSNSTAFGSPSASRETETQQEEEEDDVWDSFESAPVAQSVTDVASSNPEHKHDDDDIWNGSPKSLKDVEQPELLDESNISERPVEVSTDPKEDLESSVPNTDVSPGRVADIVERDVGGGSVDASVDLKTAVDGLDVHADVSPGDVGADAVEGDDGDVFVEAVEEIDTNPSSHGENDPAEAQEGPSKSDLHNQIIDHSGLIALAGAEAEEENPSGVGSKENGHVTEVADNALDVQKDDLDGSVELERLASLSVAHSSFNHSSNKLRL